MAVAAGATTSWGTGTLEITEGLGAMRHRAIDDYDVVGTPSEPNVRGLAARLCDDSSLGGASVWMLLPL